MRKLQGGIFVCFALVSLLLFTACEKKDTVVLIPVLTTTDVSSLTQTTAQSGGTITFDGGGRITARGICWSTNPNPTIADKKTVNGTGSGTFTSVLTGISADTAYYVRAYATNSTGTGYGNVVATLIADLDGNIYHKVVIGTQTWMLENLKTTRYRTGEGITNDILDKAWKSATYGAWCDYNNDKNNGAIYGKLYNWAAINDSRNIAPIGWHVATDADWTTLVSYLGGEGSAGAKLKEIGNSHWSAPNSGVTNVSGFTALPGGYRSPSGSFGGLGDNGYWWTATAYDSTNVRYWYMNYNNQNAHKDYDIKGYGRSVRCVKD